MIALWINLGLLTGASNVGQVTSPQPQPGTDGLWLSGWYERKRKAKTKPVKEEIDEAAKVVTEIAAQEMYRVTPAQLSRIASAVVRRESIPLIDFEAIRTKIEAAKAELQAAIEAEKQRKEIERKAGELVALISYLVDLQASEDDDFLLLAA
jgi:hypothetical protein